MQEFDFVKKQIIEHGVGKGTLEEHYQFMIKYINKMFNEIEDNIEGHDTSIGYILFPTLKIVHDDENVNNIGLLNIKNRMLEKAIDLKNIKTES